MASRFQAAALVASPSYPNAVAWSDENLVAIASGHLVTILNPAMPFGARGLITLSVSKPFSIGLIESKDLLSGSMLPICLTHDVRPVVRSISWSPIGLSPNSGCLLAVCTTEGRVKIYRLPFSEFSAEWVEVMDISEMLYTYLTNISYGELSVPLSEYSDGHTSKLATEHGSDDDDMTISLFRKKTKRRRKNALAIIVDTQKSMTLCTEVADYPLSLLQEGSLAEVLIMDGNQHVWVAGKVLQLRGGKALVVFPETDGNGKQDKWVEINSTYSSSGLADQENCFPQIRPFLDVGNFPERISFGNCYGVENILKIGHTVEAWINQRWVEVTLMGSNDSTLQVKLNGDSGLVMIDSHYVRLVPRWIDEKKSWQVTIVKIEIKGQDSFKAASLKPCNRKEKNQLQIISMPKSESNSKRQTRPKSNSPFISADEYASRSAMLSSLVVSWSPVISPNNSPNCCSVLAVGGKSGQISFWRICPRYYSIMQSVDPIAAVLIGLVQAHTSFITAINWTVYVPDPLNPQLILATASSDGSVKIWRVCSAELLNSSEDNHASFSLLKEVSSVGSIPVSVLSLIFPAKSLNQMLLAVGKTSGSLEVWSCDISTCKFNKAGSYDAHDHMVTGLSWAFSGKCLYSCGQDNSMHSWFLHGNSLHKVPMPSNTTGVKCSTDVPNVFDSCYGLSLSPGNLAVAVVRRFDSFMLNPMYQARAQKAAVEFFWIGGQKTDILSNRNPDFEAEDFQSFDHNELVNWKQNILWSLNQYGNPNKPLVIWDIVAALSAFNDSLPKYVNHVLSKWLNSYVRKETPQKSKLMNLPSRQLHLINVIGRRVVLEEVKEEKVSSKNLGECAFEEEERIFWREIVEFSEKELRERLVGFSFGAVISLVSCSKANFSQSRSWVPVGLAQMEQWVAKNRGIVKDHLKQLASKVKKLDKSKLRSMTAYELEEKCTLCSSTLQFESPEEVFCRSTSCNGGAGLSHRLNRCSVSMQVTPITPSWFCVCCHRYATNFVPHILLSTSTYPLDFRFNTETTPLEVSLRPFCPFCGILLQRLQPEFLLSPSPV